MIAHERQIMIQRAGTLFLGMMAALGGAALAQLYWHGQPMPIDPRVLGGLATLGMGGLLYGVLWMREEAARTAELHAIIASLDADIAERRARERTLVAARDKAEEANRAKSRFLATMSHEIRTPMNGVLGMARLLLETPLAADQKTYADAISQSGLGLMSLIENILDFSKIESGTFAIENGDVALRPLLEGVVELLATRAHAKGIDIIAAVAADVPATVRTDAIVLRQVLTNLIGNAIKFTERGGVLVSASIEPRPEGSFLRLCVRDTGVGVAEEKRVHIFEEFVQADSSRARRFEGTGLGLAISKRLVQALGGEIGVTPAADRGSLFWLRLRLDEISAQRASPALSGKRIAVFSESSILNGGLKLQLEAAGAIAVECHDPATLSHLAQNCDALILAPSADDSETLPNVRALGIPALALLPPQHRLDPTAMREEGIVASLTKPVRQLSLEARIIAALAGETEFEIAKPTLAAEQRAMRPLSVLVAEDNPVNALLIRELLRRRGHRVHVVTTGEAAIDTCRAANFDVVLMDLHMPGLDGIEAARRIRAAENSGGSCAVPIFALTANALDTGRRACLEAGMDGFLTKPVDPAELDAVLSELTGDAAVAAA